MTSREDMTPFMRMTSADPENRELFDYYPTHPNATKALLREVNFEGILWDPACGEGYMSEVFKSDTTCEVASSDIKYYGYGRKEPLDFLEVSLETTEDYSIRQMLLAPSRNNKPLNIVTNPPFKYALKFAQKALELTKPQQGRVPGKVALLCRLMFLEATTRYDFFTKEAPLAKVFVFSDRVPFQRGRLQGDDEQGGKTTPYAWFLFDHTHSGPPTLHWIKFNPKK